VDENQPLVLAELKDCVEHIFAAVETLRANVGNGKTRCDWLDLIFRNVHSLKAAAAVSGFDNGAQLAHQFEGFLQTFRAGHLSLDGETLSLIEEAGNALLSCLEHPDAMPSRALTERLQQLAMFPTQSKPATSDLVASLSSEITGSLNHEEKHKLVESIVEGASLYLVEATFASSDFDQRFQSLRRRLAEKGEIVSTAPALDEHHPDKINFRILYTRTEKFDVVRQELAATPGVLVNQLLTSFEDSGLPLQSSPEELTAARQLPLRMIQISVDDLDRLISRTHKLFRDTTKFLNREADGQSVYSIQANSLHAGFVELAAELVNLRMVPIERVLYRAVRSGRIAARASGKEINFSVHGQDILLDKSLCDAVADPLIHLVRNAVDHGIEKPEQRVRAGKNKQGSVHIEASVVQGQTRITVTDDGRGIDPELVSTAARSQQIIDGEAVLTFAQSMRLIFRPGFSTAAEASAISGRGVGLDVVEAAIEEAGGDVRVSSMPAVGSSFEIRLPVTFALLEVWIVRVGSQRYLIDGDRVLQSHTISVGAVETSATGATTDFGGEPLQIVRLSDLLDQAQLEVKSNEINLLVCQFPKEHSDEDDAIARVGVIVDAVEGTEKVLLRNLGSRGGRWYGVTGAAELLDGKVALMLDVPRLINRVQAGS
jgi:two-component system chemotaxis sensor kinase CheA